METATVTLSNFLLARVAEDEDAAKVAARYPEVGAGWLDRPGGTFIEHLRRHDPARVLAECEAKRRIVELRYSWNLQAERNPEPPFGPILQAQVNTADAVLRTLALPYADHPDYRDEWRP